MNQPASEVPMHSIIIDPKYDEMAVMRGALLVTEFIGTIKKQRHAEAAPLKGARTMDVEIPFMDTAPARLIENFRSEAQRIFEEGATMDPFNDDTINSSVINHYEQLAVGL